jgi:SAM-dependent methyltransferase
LRSDLHISRPSSEIIEQLYSQDTAHLSTERQIAGRYYSTLRARHNLAIIKRHIRDGRLLEIGAGNGCFVSQTKKAGFLPYAVEPNPVLAQFINENYKIVCKPFLNDFADMRFDIIYHCDVLSHFYNPVSEFKQMRNLLVDNGLLVFETGNLADAGSGYLKLIDCFQYPDHLFLFGRKSINKLLETTGFELIEIYSRSILFQLIGLWCRNRILDIFSSPRKNRGQAGNFAGKPRFTRKIYDAFLYVLVYELGRIRLQNCPQTLLVVARKKAVAAG